MSGSDSECESSGASERDDRTAEGGAPEAPVTDETSSATVVDELTKEVGRIHIATGDGEEPKNTGDDEVEPQHPPSTVSPAAPPSEPIPEEINTLAEWIVAAERILVLTGAGVSCAAGIPDFRTPGTGLYDNLQKYNLPYAEAVFDLRFFRKRPQPFVSLAAALWPSQHVPTYTHSFLAYLAEPRGKLLRNYSQNIDGLEHLAGVPVDRLLECHGHFRTATCVDCARPADPAQVEADIRRHARSTPCRHCRGGLVKPDIVFFGEDLPARFHALLPADAAAADLCLVMGTSLQVAPVNAIPGMVACPVALVNREPVASRAVDLFCPGDCDATVRLLARALGWREELDAFHARMVRRVTEEARRDPTGAETKP